MRIKKYGIVLESLSESDLELVRRWRNSDHVRLNMHYQGIITAEMQQSWFQSLHPSKNLYFIILQNEKQVGVIHLKDMHLNLKTAEAGIFIGDVHHLNTMLPVLATVTIMELAFENIGLTWLRAKMSASNLKTIEFNERIGYRRAEFQQDEQFPYYHCAHDSFYSATKGIRDTLSKLDNNLFEIQMKNSEMRQLGLTPANFSRPGLKVTIS